MVAVPAAPAHRRGAPEAIVYGLAAAECESESEEGNGSARAPAWPRHGGGSRGGCTRGLGLFVPW